MNNGTAGVGWVPRRRVLKAVSNLLGARHLEADTRAMGSPVGNRMMILRPRGVDTGLRSGSKSPRFGAKRFFRCHSLPYHLSQIELIQPEF